MYISSAGNGIGIGKEHKAAKVSDLLAFMSLFDVA